MQGGNDSTYFLTLSTHTSYCLFKQPFKQTFKRSKRTCKEETIYSDSELTHTSYCTQFCHVTVLIRTIGAGKCGEKDHSHYITAREYV